MCGWQNDTQSYKTWRLYHLNILLKNHGRLGCDSSHITLKLITDILTIFKLDNENENNLGHYHKLLSVKTKMCKRYR
jgi:hypothetical protein